jgi:hypothetical protein
MLLHGSEAWTITAVVLKRLKAMEVWCYREMMVKWRELSKKSWRAEKKDEHSQWKKRSTFREYIAEQNLLRTAVVGEMDG